MVKYIAKKDTWFKEGTEAKRLEDFDGFGLYEGIYIVGSCNPDGYDKFWYEKNYKDGDEVLMSEVCDNSEFEINIINE